MQIIQVVSDHSRLEIQSFRNISASSTLQRKTTACIPNLLQSVTFALFVFAVTLAKKLH